MKKTILILILVMASLSLSAQERVYYSIEFLEAGIGFGTGPKIVLAPDFVVQFNMGDGFKAGAGVGLRFAVPCTRVTINESSGKRSRSLFRKELDLPLFLRLSYGIGKFGLALDAGYAIGLVTVKGKSYGSDIVPGQTSTSGSGLRYSSGYNGMFFEPQVSWMIDEESALSLGLLMQQNTLQFYTQKGSSSVSAVTENVFAPAVTLKYGFRF